MDYKLLVEMIHQKHLDSDQLIEINSKAFEALKNADPKTYENLKQWLENLAYSISKEDAEKIVKAMEPRGQVWSCDQVKELVEARGIHDNFVDWYLVMNMCYNDYYDTAKIYGLQNDENFYFNLAKNFIEDPDAKPHKVARYFS